MARRDDLLRYALWASAGFNAGGALLFLFPESLGALAGLPTGAPRAHLGMIVLFILLFAGAYAWLATQPHIDRPLVGLAAIGKTGAFTVALGLWLAGDVPLRTAVLFAGDLLFAALFAWWLLGPRTEGVSA